MASKLIALCALACTANAQDMTVVDVLSDEKYSTLLFALEAAGLNDTLKGDGPFTASSKTTCTRARGGIATLISLESIV